ncbi:MAG: c-type cytochrome [Acidobacteriaceae bacterium]|nr:c-type cytochrome [Acidobacteriaceae bacterium]
MTQTRRVDGLAASVLACWSGRLRIAFPGRVLRVPHVMYIGMLSATLLRADDQGPSEAAKRGQAQFAQSCGFCHAPDATGTGEAPNLLRSELVRHDENGNLIGPVIRDGRPTRGMPAIRLNDSQISDVIAFLRYRMEASDRATPGDPNVLTLKRLLTGDASAGKRFFGARCAGCHSVSGDLAGIGSKYPPAELQARFLYPAGVKKRATVTTATGKQIGGDLVYKDEFDIAIQSDAGFYHSWPISEVAIKIDDPLSAHLGLLHSYTNADMHNLFAYLVTLK